MIWTCEANLTIAQDLQVTLRRTGSSATPVDYTNSESAHPVECHKNDPADKTE